MLYALRKLIAFVFLGGIFWFIYRDPAKIGKPVFMNTLGILTLVFGVFWLTIPGLVVQMRIRKRIRKNRAGFAAWRSGGGEGKLVPLPKKACRLELAEGETAYAHEKGTVYVESGAGLDAVAVPGRPGDVAFPKLRRCDRKIQRTHYYLTDRRIALCGKELNTSIVLADVVRVEVRPGGLVFFMKRDGGERAYAFTFPNPLVAEAQFRAVCRR